MRDPASALGRLPKSCVVGEEIREALLPLLAEHESIWEVVSTTLKGFRTSGFSDTAISSGHQKVLAALGVQEPSSPKSGLQPDLIEMYCKASGAPDLPLAEWLRSGAPKGAFREITKVGVFPPDTKDDKQCPSSLSTHSLLGWENFRSADDAPEIVAELHQGDGYSRVGHRVRQHRGRPGGLDIPRNQGQQGRPCCETKTRWIVEALPRVGLAAVRRQPRPSTRASASCSPDPATWWARLQNLQAPNQP